MLTSRLIFSEVGNILAFRVAGCLPSAVTGGGVCRRERGGRMSKKQKSPDREIRAGLSVKRAVGG